VVEPVAGVHYPRAEADLRSWFATDADCLDYLEWLRWPQGFVCPRCAAADGWRLRDGRFECRPCGARTSVTAGTIFDRTRTPLTVWFAACWLFVSRKNGVSALGLQKTLGIGSYQTAWAMLHRIRSALVRPGRDRLSGRVEVDECLIGGHADGDLGGRAMGEKVLVGIAVEMLSPKGLGRCRMSVIPIATGPVLRRFLMYNVVEGSTVVTDGFKSYWPATRGWYIHERHVAPGVSGPEALPGTHRLASLVKRWLLGTRHSTMDEAHTQLYLNEYVFRFNRRRSRSRVLLFYRLLELAVDHDPVRYRDLIAKRRPGQSARKPPQPTRRQPLSLNQPAADRPWRQHRTNVNMAQAADQASSG
jgi:transposase-like protein